MLTMGARPRRARHGILLLTLVALIGGCSGGSVPTASPSPGGSTPSSSLAASPTAGTSNASIQPVATPTPTPTPTPPPTPERTRAGTITLIATQRGYVDEERADRDDPVFARGSVRTDENGSLRFALDQKVEGCLLVASTRVGILPSDDVLLQFEEGTAVCRTTRDPGLVTMGATSGVELRMSDPEFLVTVESDVTIVRVLTGLVEVGSAGGTVLVGPKTRTDIVPGERPGEPGSWGTGELPDDVRDAVNDLENLPGPDMSMPGADGSPTLERILQTGTIMVGKSDAIFAEPGDEFADFSNDAFVAGFFQRQTFDWKLDPHVSDVMTEGEGIETLLAGEIDVFLAPGPIAGLGQIPLFDDEEGRRVWIHYDPDDTVFGAAERRYLTDYVVEESYRINYLESFGDEPTYDAVAELFSLD